nr:hypothetical protein [Tanacetum cinerariifolium]
MMAKLSDSEDMQCAGFDHDHYQEAACAYYEEHMMDDCVRLDHVVDSQDEYTYDSNIIMCDQHVRDNEVPVVHSGASSVPTDAFMMIYDDMCEPHDQSVSYPSWNTKQLTPKQIFWSNDLMKIKSEALKERTKDNFEGIQKALTKEVKEMKDVFEELETEVARHAVVRKHDAIELKNLLIANDNLIAKCLSQEVFYVAINSELNVARFTDMHVANTTAETRCLALEAELAILRETNNHDNQMELINHFSKLKELSQLQVTHQDTDRTLRVQTTDSQTTKLTDQVTHLQAQNDLFRAKNDKIKQHYKELYDSIKIMCAKHIKQVTKLTTENMNLKIGVSKATINPLVSVRDKHAIDVKPIVPRLRNNRNAHLDYLRHLKESVETIRDIVEEVKFVRTLDRSIVSACRYTKHSQELLEYAIGTCPHGSEPRTKQLAHIPLIRKKQVIVAQPSNKVDSTTHPHVVTVTSQKINVPVPPSTGVDCCPIARGSQPMSHVKPNRISPAK